MLLTYCVLCVTLFTCWADATSWQKVEVKWVRVETSGGVALPNTLPPALRRTLSYVFETPSPVHNYPADLSNHVLQFCLRVTYAPPGHTGSTLAGCQQMTAEYIRQEYPSARVKASRGPLKLANNLAVNLSLTLVDRVGPWAIGFERNNSQSPRYSASALLAGVAGMGADRARRTCEHHGLPIDGVFCAAINRALRDEWRGYGIVSMILAVKDTGCTPETRLHWLNTRRLLRGGAWDTMFQHAIAHERAQAHKRVRQEGSCAAGLKDNTSASSPPASTSSPYNELPLEQCGDDRTSCSACGRCFRANEYVIEKHKKLYAHEEEFVTVPADVQVGGNFEHTFASGETVGLTVPVGAGPGYRLKSPDILRAFEMWGGTFFAGATKPDDCTTTDGRERLLVRAEHCRRKVLPVLFRLPVADRWMLFVDGRDHHRGDLAYERGLTRAKWHTRAHGNELPGWTDENDSSYLGYWHIAYDRIALTCAVPLSAELVVQFLVWLMHPSGTVDGVHLNEPLSMRPTHPLAMPGLYRIFRSYPRTNDDAIGEPLRDWFPASVRADLEKYGVEKLLAQERDGEARVRDMWEAVKLFVRWYHSELKTAQTLLVVDKELHRRGIVLNKTKRHGEAVFVAVCRLVWRLLVMHPFNDGNSRVATAVLNRELALNGFVLALMHNSRVEWLEVNTFDDYCDLVREGMRAWSAAAEAAEADDDGLEFDDEDGVEFDDDDGLESDNTARAETAADAETPMYPGGSSPWLERSFITRHAKRFPNNIRKLRRPSTSRKAEGTGEAGRGEERGGEADPELHPFYIGIGTTYAELERFYA